MRKPLQIAGIAALLAAELGIAAFALTPDVSENYRQYYIERSTGCLLGQAGDGVYQPGVIMSLKPNADRAFQRVLVCGFSYGWTHGAAVLGREARLAFRDPPPVGDLQFDFEVRPGLGKGWTRQVVTVVANGRPVSHFQLDRFTWTLQRVLIPAEVVAASADGALDLRFELADTRDDRSKAPDGHRLSLTISWMRLSPTEKSELP